ncbi:MAG: GNAT family N-acetyltransferase [Gammaproteobacteria bacterium]|nr:GNAT family N-acetyltransferase [Gammaproteobacteria bacterium]
MRSHYESHFKKVREKYTDKFASEDLIFRNIHRGDRIFIGTGCGEPQYLVDALTKYVQEHPTAVYDAEVMHVWSLGIAPYANTKFHKNFRQNTFFVGHAIREEVNKGLADYTPMFLSEVPAMFKKGTIPIDVALIQVSLPDEHGFVSLGISVDIVKPAFEVSKIVIAQVNVNMPRVHGNSFVHIKDIDFLIRHDEELLEYSPKPDGEIASKIGEYISRLVEDGDTIQVGYGSIPNGVLANLKEKKDLGVHTELISDGLVELIKAGVINNKNKTIDNGKTVAAFSMGQRSTYEFLNDNPAVEFRSIAYTNNPINIAAHEHIVAINSGLELDLTGQATAESIGAKFYSGIGGQADFMRGAVLAKNGRTIFALPSVTSDGKISRIVPFLKEGSGISLVRGDVHYVVTEYGIAYLHGKNIRERVMELISIAHPKFKGWLLKEAKKNNLIYQDQAYVPGKKGEYQEHLESYRTTEKKYEILLRPVKLSDESLLKEFFHYLSDESLYKRFISHRKDMPHSRLQEFTVTDNTKELVILATIMKDNKEIVLGISQYGIHGPTHTAEVAFAIRDDYQNKGIGSELIKFLIGYAKKQGLLGFTAEVLNNNQAMLHLFKRHGFKLNNSGGFDPYCKELTLTF